MSFLQQFSARPWAVALSHCCTCRIGMAPTQYLNVKCGGFTVSRGHFRNISNVVCIPHYHFPLNSITYSIKHFTPLFRKQKLSCLQHCFRTYSKSLMLYDSGNLPLHSLVFSITLYGHLAICKIFGVGAHCFEESSPKTNFSKIWFDLS
jgi:hypothetical protein